MHFYKVKRKTVQITCKCFVKFIIMCTNVQITKLFVEKNFKSCLLYLRYVGMILYTYSTRPIN